ncbi:hypothetical protein [Streptomyces sp. NPDC091268]|uniref:hypothetical protein n=1 Tax=Streptomyces sp. NPDC091268 TaxID=3365979 RepID=UPI0037FF3541
MSTSTPQTAVPAGPGATAPRRRRGRVFAAVLCGLLGAGATGAAAYGVVSEHRAAHRLLAADAAYRKAASLWRTTPVDTLFPPVLAGPGAGPGGADRSWTRIALAPDADCPAALPADWRTLLSPAGCTRVLRATYTDATRSSLVTVGMVFAPAGSDTAALRDLRGRLPAPPGYGFDDDRRAAWTATVLPEAPVVVYAVSAFNDGRTLDAPRPAEELMRKDAAGPAARAGLGHETRAVADRVERAVRALAAPPAAPPTPPAAAAPEPAR